MKNESDAYAKSGEDEVVNMEDTVSNFSRMWQSDLGAEKVSFDALQSVEHELNINFPVAYKYLLLRFGVLYTPDLLDAIVDAEIDIYDIQNFINPENIVEQTKTYASAGMPAGYVCVANDSMGNMFCYKIAECQSNTSEPSVWFFDHDFCEIEEIFSNTVEWLSSYNELKRS